MIIYIVYTCTCMAWVQKLKKISLNSCYNLEKKVIKILRQFFTMENVPGHLAPLPPPPNVS